LCICKTDHFLSENICGGTHHHQFFWPSCLLLNLYEEAGTVKHETLVKSFKIYDVTEGDVLFEESGFSSETDISDDSRDSVTSSGLIQHCPLLE
jgi:hypothetical protein